SVVSSFSPMIEEGVTLGLHEEELDEFRAHAEDAAAADDLEEVYRLKGDLQERLLDAKRHQIVKRSMNEIQSLDELVTQSERRGVPSNAARTHLDGARRAIEEGNVDGFGRGLPDARAARDAPRTSRSLQKDETRAATGCPREPARSSAPARGRREGSRRSGRSAWARSSRSASASSRKAPAPSRLPSGSRTSGSSTRTATRSGTRRRSGSNPSRRIS